MNIFKRIYKFFFPDKERKADRAQQQVIEPQSPLSSVRKPETIKKEIYIYRIFPNFFSKPGTSIFRKPQARKRNQIISYWDDEVFPERWRHKLIRH